MRKKLAAFLLAALMVIEGFPIEAASSSAAQPYAQPSLNAGDYFILGKYLNEEIVWRHVGSDGHGDVALSFRVLTSKAYNSKGIKPANSSVPDGVLIPQEVDPRGDRANHGSNIWVNSTLRAWLNSTASSGQVKYIGASPTGGNVNNNGYGGEAGFLSNFTEAQRAVMATKSRPAALNEVDIALRTAGHQIPGWDNGVGLTDPIRHMVTDTVFLPDARLLSQIAADSSLDWRVGYWSTGFHRAGITDSAVAQAEATAQRPSGEYGAVDYWTGTPQGSQWGGTHQMQIRLVGGGHSFVNVNEGIMGVRPAFYINHANVAITGGSGAQDDPYILGGFDAPFDLTLKGSNTERLYAPETDTLQISATPVPDLELYYITVDPEDGTPKNDVSDFSGATPLTPAGGKATLIVDRNCTVWVMAKGTAGGGMKTAFESITYKNFYEPVKLYQQGKPEGEETYLYHPTRIDGVYGIPINKFRNQVLGVASYDSVNVIAQETALPENMRGFWTRSGGPGSIVLNDISYVTNPQPITMRYSKASGAWVTVNLYFVDDNGEEIAVSGVGQQPVVKANWIPQGKTLSQAGISYDVPEAVSVDSSLIPYKWVMYDTNHTFIASYQEADDPESIGFDPQMPNDITEVAIRIYYKDTAVVQQHMVTEKHVYKVTTDVDNVTTEVLRTNPVSIQNGDSYKRSIEPKIDHYVVTGYDYPEGSVTLSTDGDGRPVWDADTIVTFKVTADTTVIYYYAADANGDGIPDSSQVRLTTRWTGVYSDSRPNTAIKTDITETVLKGESIIVTNDGAGGNPADIIAAENPPPGEQNAQWIFNPSARAASQKVTPQADTVVRFYYDYDSFGTNIPDKNHGVTTKFAVYDGTYLSYPQGWTDIFTNMLKGSAYVRSAPSRDNYVPVGWLLDSEDIDDLNQLEVRNGNQAEFTTSKPNHTVTFVYRATAEPVTIRWVGRASTGNKIDFGYVNVTGYDGEVLTIDRAKLLESVTVDPASWVLNETYTDVPDSITLSQDEQEFFFYYDEVVEFYYDIHYISSDSKTLKEVTKIQKKTTDQSFTIKAPEFDQYDYTGYEIREFGEHYANGLSDTITLDPAQGALSVFFFYSPAVPTTADVILRAVERGTGNEIFTTIYTDKRVGQIYSVSAPYIDGWALAQGEHMIRMVRVSEEGNTVTFEYERPASVFIQCIEMRESKEVVLRTVPVTKTGKVTPPDLKGDYFIFDETAIDKNSPNPYDVTNEDFAKGKVIRYFYKSRTMDVKIVAVDIAGAIITTLVMPGAARMGEMYTATALPAETLPIPPGYTLSDEPTKEVYADPALSVVEVRFTYSRLAPGQVVVRHFYMDGGTKVILKEFSEQAAAGSEYTPVAGKFPGFSLLSVLTPITVVGNAVNIIELEYKDVRRNVKVEISKNGGTAETYQTYKVPAGEEFTVFPPYVNEYSVVGYSINGGGEVTTDLAAIEITVTEDVTVTLKYVSYVNITVIGKETDTDGKVLFQYVERVRHGKEFTLDPAEDLPRLETWELRDGSKGVHKSNPTGDTTLEFYYDYTLTTVKIKAQLTDGSAVPGFATIVINDVPIGEIFSYDAPYISGYKLKDLNDAVKTITPTAGGDNTITFVYEHLPEGNVHVILKEDDRNGGIIRTEEYTLSYGDSMTVDVPDLSRMFYTALSTPKTVTYNGVDITIEYYYERDTVQVIKKTYKEVADGVFILIQSFDMGNYRIGANVRFYAPVKGDDLKLNDEALKVKRIFPPSTFARAVLPMNVRFNYAYITDRLVVEAVSESGYILLSYSVTGETDERITVPAPIVTGYVLKSGQPLSQTGVVPGKVTFVYKREDGGNFGDLTVLVKSTSGAAISGAEVIVKRDGLLVRSNKTDSSGKAMLYDLPAANTVYDITAKRSGYYDKTTPVTLYGDQTVEIRLSAPSAPGGGTGVGPPVSGGGGGGASGGGGGAVVQPPVVEDVPDLPPEGLLEKTKHVKYINGFEDGTVRPDAYITRAETAAIFYSLLKEPPETVSSRFYDVGGDAWYARAVNALAAIRILSGYPDGSFRPFNTITRAELTAIVSRFEELEKTGVSYFGDVGEEHWATAYINSAYTKGWISGYPSGNFKPDNPITRAEVVTVANRILGRKIRKEDIPDWANVFSDLPKEHWAYADVLEAATEHGYVINEDGYEIWEAAKGAQSQ